MDGGRATARQERAVSPGLSYSYLQVGVYFADLATPHARSSSMPPRRVARLTLAALLGFSASCSVFRRGGAAHAAPAAAAAVRVVGPTDGEITAILLAANNTDISYAKLAPSRAQSQAVKDFAALMIKDHTGVNTLVNDL